MAGNTEGPSTECWLGKADLCARFHVDTATVSQWVKRGDLSAPLYLFGRARWRLADVLAFEAAHLKAKPAANAGNLRFSKGRP